MFLLKRRYQLMKIFKDQQKNEFYELNLKGLGSNDDPIIIDSVEGISNFFNIIDSNLYIRIKDCNFSYLKGVTITNSSNITIENCKFNIIIIRKCSDLDLKNIDILQFSYIKISERIRIEACKTDRLDMYSVKHSDIIKSSIDALRTLYIFHNKFYECNFKTTLKFSGPSRDNYFLKCMIPPNSKKIILNKIPFRNKFIRDLTLPSIPITMLIIMVIYPKLFIQNSTIISLILFFLVIPIPLNDLLLSLKYIRRYNPNRIVDVSGSNKKLCDSR